MSLSTVTDTALALPSRTELVGAFLAGRTEATRRAYHADLIDFAAFVGAPDPDAAVGALLSRGHGLANALAHAYRAHLIERDLSPATINRRLAALRSVVKLARTVGVVSWALDVESVKSQKYRDTRGPGLAGFRAMLAALAAMPDTSLVRRDRAILRLLFDLGLRRAEVTRLDRADIDLDAGTVAVLGKGRTERVTLTLPAPTVAALSAWFDVHEADGAAFVALDRASGGKRLSGTSVARLVARVADAAGLGTVRPHGLRHAAITHALDLTNGNVRTVAAFSRHRDVRTVSVYDDNRTDVGGAIAALVAEGAS